MAGQEPSLQAPVALKKIAEPGPSERGSVAIVHDYLNQCGGAERVVLEMARLFPHAPIYTSLYRPKSTFPGFAGFEIRTSPIDRLPIDAAFRSLFALYPMAFRSFGTLPHDLVISSSSGWAHAVSTRQHAVHVVYCHTPARWLYGYEHLGASKAERVLRPALPILRRWDRRAARQADLYIANSRITQRRILAQYGREAPIVSPPVDTERFAPLPRGERLLVVSRLLPYKRVDLVVDAATRAGIGLDIVGTGPALEDLLERAGPTVAFHGAATDGQITSLMEGCRTFCLPGVEEFGITAVEAQAAGKPVVAFAAGGALETVIDGISGAFFDDPSPEAVLGAIREADRIDTPPQKLAVLAARFSHSAFRARLCQAIDRACADVPSQRARRSLPQ